MGGGLLRTVRCRSVQASSSSGSKAKWSPEKAKDLFVLIKQEDCSERKKKKKEKRKRKGKRGFKREQGGDVSGHEVSLVTTATDERRAHP